MSIWQENYQLMKQLREYSITYVTFVESGGKAGDFDQQMIDKAIAVAVKIKENRDYIQKTLGRPIPTKQQECQIAVSILNGTYKADRLSSVMNRIM